MSTTHHTTVGGLLPDFTRCCRPCEWCCARHDRIRIRQLFQQILEPGVDTSLPDPRNLLVHALWMVLLVLHMSVVLGSLFCLAVALLLVTSVVVLPRCT